jgi:uncharacterized protein YhfF
MTTRAEVERLALELQRHGIQLPPGGSIRVTRFGDSPELSEELLSLIRSGRKRGGASLLWAGEADHEPLPSAGDIEIVLDHRNAPRFVTRISKVEIVAFAEVGAQFAAREGEGDGSLEHWRRAHSDFFSRECRRLGREPSDAMPVVCSAFELLSIVPTSRVGDWAICVGVLMASLGVLGAYVPEVFVAVVRFFQAPPMIYLAAGIRVAVGVILWLAAQDSRTPMFFRILGAFIFVGGVLTPFFGAAIGRTILDMWASYGHAMVRTWGLIATALGVFIIFSVMSPRQSAR